MPFDIKTQREPIEQEYIGFSPNTHSVKPVHLANGLFRGLLGHSYDTRSLFRFVFTSKSDGTIPRGHEQAAVYNWLVDAERFDQTEISPEQIEKLRQALHKVVAADRPSAVSPGGMESYSAGSIGFVSNDRIAQDAGEFLALWLQNQAPSFTRLLLESLLEQTDPITLLAKPLLGDQIPAKMQIKNPERIRCLNGTSPATLRYSMQKLADAAGLLARHLEQHPNKLARMRMAILFCAFLVVRYMADLEYMYIPGTSKPQPVFLLDFSGDDRHPVRLASQRSYVLLCQSVTRFYVWMLADYLRNQYALPDLLTPPTYGQHPTANDQQICREVWQTALDESQTATDPYSVFGQAIYDILALIAQATPIQYLRQIGIRGGLFWPPYNWQPTKQMSPRQDMLEVLIRSVVAPGDTLNLTELQDRLLQTFGIVIGGRSDDIDVLLQAGIYQADSQALEQNQAAFTQQLSDLSFARLLADGVLEVQIGSSWN